MKSTFAILLAALASTAVTIVPAIAGSSGNGWAQRNGAAGLRPGPQAAQYVFCYGGNPKVVYFTGVFSLASATNPTDLGIRYRHYVETTYGLPSIDRERCVTANTIASATAEKQRYKEMLGRERMMETEWTGG